VNSSERSLLERALACRSSEEVWRTLAPLRPRIVEDREIAEAWLTLLEASAGRQALEDDVRAALWAFPGDVPLLLLGLRALLRADERRGPDEPQRAGGPAEQALALAERALAALPADAPERAPVLAAVANAHRRLGPRHDAEAVRAFEAALKLDPSDGTTWFDCGLCHKWAGRFRAAWLAFQRAEERSGPTRAVLFNRAVCATASGQVVDAADAWRRLGMRVELAEGALPRVLAEDGQRLPDVWVRVPTRGTGHAEVGGVPDAAVAFENVGVEPLSPCHGVVRTPTRRHAIVDFGDVVLFDPAPVARVATEEGARPVLPLLSVLAPGDERRFAFLALEQQPGQVRALGARLPEGCVWFVHETRVDRVCPRCAAGDVLGKHEHEPPTERRAVRGKLVVPAQVELATARAALEAGKGADVMLAIPGLYEALGETASAGKHHKSWGVIERGLLAASTQASARD
jgi:tetratricopeptide (TPR) repeat protein